MSENKNNNQLKKALGLKDIIFLSLGVILGAGIYAIIGEAAGLAGNMLWLSFLIAAFVAFLSALSYAEFVSRFPDAGGSFEYIRQTFGIKTAYIFGTGMLLTGVVASAAIAISFADYLGKLWSIPDYLAITGIIALLGLVNIIGIKHSSITNIVATVITVIGLMFVIALGFPKWGEADLLASPPEGFMGILAAGALTFFAYIGFEDVVKTSEETKDPRKTVSRGILISAVVVAVIYVLVAISTVNLKNWEELAGSGSPLALAIKGSVGRWGVTALIVVALFATANSILTNILGTARLLFDIARDSDVGWLKKLTVLHEKASTPVYATILIVVVTIVIGLIGNLKIVASVSNLLMCTVFIAVNVSLIRWRYKNMEDRDAEFRIPLNIRNIPVPSVLATISLIVLLGFNVYNMMTGQGGGH